ncbi:N-alpha-acetyltransferase 40 [Globisporangium polare]
MRLSCGEELVTLGPQLRLKKNTFQGLVLPLCDASQASTALAKVKQVPRLRKFQHFPHALRMRRSSINSGGNGPEVCAELHRKTNYRVSDDPGVFESWEDDGEGGVGDRLLHLLQRWQVENVVVLVARQDDSLCGRLIGAELFKLNVEAAKLALEQYYLENISPSDTAKMELMEVAPTNTAGGPYQPLSARSQPENNASSSSSQPTASVCLMTSETIPSWPIKHQPTSDGGGHKGVRQGRINHFLNRRGSGSKTKPSFKAAPDLAEAHNPLSIGRNQHDFEVGDENAGVTHASGGIEWLGISRDELLKLKSIRVPVKELHYLFMCIVILLETPPEGRKIRAKPTPKQQEEFTPTNFSWMRCRETLHQSYYWSERLRGLHGSKLAKSQVTALRALFQEPSFNENAFIRVSVASIKIFAWLQRLLDEYDEMELGLRDQQGPPRADIEDEIEIKTQAPSSPVGQQKLQPRPPPPQAQSHEKEEQQLAKEFYLHGLASTATSSTTSSRAPHAVKIVDKGRLFNHASR